MPYPSNALTVPSTSQSTSVTPSGPFASGTGTGPRVAPDILTYSYASRMVYVTPGESYDVRFPLARPLSERFFLILHPPARHRYRQGVLHRTQGCRTRANKLGSTRRAQEPADTQNR